MYINKLKSSDRLFKFYLLRKLYNNYIFILFGLKYFLFYKYKLKY